MSESKRYYAERNGLLKSENGIITLKELRSYFEETYHYFTKKDYFKCAIIGVEKHLTPDEVYYQSPPTLAPSPTVFFMNHLREKKVWPIEEYCDKYSEETLFSVIEILYDHIAIYDYSASELDKIAPRTEYAGHINNILKLYKDGYYLEPKNGFISKLPNQALREQLECNTDALPETVLTQLSTATKMYYRFDSNIEEKKKAINILADILEKERNDVQILLNHEYNVNKNCHDKLIFDIVNNFNIRHNKDNQMTGYSKEIWYDWMMQYYTSIILAYYRLKANYSQ